MLKLLLTFFFFSNISFGLLAKWNSQFKKIWITKIYTSTHVLVSGLEVCWMKSIILIKYLFSFLPCMHMIRPFVGIISLNNMHDDVIKWKHFPRYWPFVTGEFPTQRPVTQSFDVFFDLWLNKQFSKQLWGWWFEMPSWPLWRHSNVAWKIFLWCSRSCDFGTKCLMKVNTLYSDNS